MEAILQFFTDAAGNATLVSIYQAVLRIAMPVLAFFIVLRCARSLLGFRREPEIWAWLRLSTGELVPVTHWENLIGRKKTADILSSKCWPVWTRISLCSFRIWREPAAALINCGRAPTTVTIFTFCLPFPDQFLFSVLSSILFPIASRWESQ